MTSHELMGGKLQVYQRGNSRFWQCSASVGGKQRRASTKEESLALAKQIAEDWYLALRGKDRAGLLRLLHQLSDRSRPRDHCRCGGLDRGAPGRGDGG